MTRMFILRCALEDSEAIIRPAKVAPNRLKTLAVKNKMAAVEGLLVMKREDAEKVTAAIVCLRGTVSQKQLKALGLGLLKMPLRKVALRSGMHDVQWDRVFGRAPQDWRKGTRKERVKLRTKAVEWLTCLHCMSPKQVNNSDYVWDSLKFTILKCKPCGTYSSSRLWRCSCGTIAHKCPLHFQSGRQQGVFKNWHLMARRVLKNKRRRAPLHGLDEPLPKKMRGLEEVTLCRTRHILEGASEDTNVRPKKILRAGTRLAEKFPHLVKGGSD